MAAPALRVQSLPKSPPHSLEAEQNVLGAMLISPQAWELAAPLVHAEDFYRADHQLIYREASKFLTAGKQCDFVILTDHLRKEGRLDEAGGPGYLASLAVEMFSLTNVEGYARIVAEHAKRRRVIALCADVGDAAYGRVDANALLEQLSVGLEQVGRAETGKAKTFGQVLDAADKAVMLAKAKREAGGLLGAPTGIPCLDQRTGGLCKSKLFIIAARPGLGKSALLNQIAVHAARHGHPGFVASLEMDDEELGIRAMASAAVVNVTRLTFGATEEHARACEASVGLMELPLWVDTDTYELAAICAQIAHHKRVHGITWAAVDHIGLVETDGYNTRNEQLGAITRALKKLAKKLDICIVALSQLNRTVEKERRRPMLADLRDSGSIEQDANLALFLHSDAEDSDAQIPVLFGLLKNRGGRKGWINKRIDFDGATQRFIECDAPAFDPLTAPRARVGRDHKREAAGDS
jgi:replicative DNA helicase